MNYLPIISISILLFSVILAILYLIGREFLNKLGKEKNERLERMKQAKDSEPNPNENFLFNHD